MAMNLISLVPRRTKVAPSIERLKGLLLRDPEGIARQDTQNGYKIYKKHVREIKCIRMRGIAYEKGRG